MGIYVDTIELLSVIEIRNEYDGLNREVSAREVFATAKSVRMSEKYQAAATGFSPEIVFELSDYLDYQDERYIRFEGREYRVIRTYQPPENKKLELICEHLVNNAEVYGDGNA